INNNDGINHLYQVVGYCKYNEVPPPGEDLNSKPVLIISALLFILINPEFFCTSSTLNPRPLSTAVIFKLPGKYSKCTLSSFALECLITLLKNSCSILKRIIASFWGISKLSPFTFR